MFEVAVVVSSGLVYMRGGTGRLPGRKQNRDNIKIWQNSVFSLSKWMFIIVIATFLRYFKVNPNKKKNEKKFFQINCRNCQNGKFRMGNLYDNKTPAKAFTPPAEKRMSTCTWRGLFFLAVVKSCCPNYMWHYCGTKVLMWHKLKWKHLPNKIFR